MDAGHLPSPRRVPGVGEGPGHGARRGDRNGEGLGSARTRRRRLLHRHQVVVHSAGRCRSRGQTPLLGGQRRRVRTRHVQRHSADAGHTARARRGRHHRRLRDPGQPRVHLRAWRGAAGVAPPAERGGRGIRRGTVGPQHQWLRIRSGTGGPRRRGRLHLRRGDRAAGFARGPARSATPAAPPSPRLPGSTAARR